MIQFNEFGAPNDQLPLYVFPGIDGSIGSVEPMVKQLAQNRRVVVVDYSEENNNSLEELTLQISLLIKERTSDKIDVLGQSIGTVIAAQVATRYGLEVDKVVLTCTFTKLNWMKLKASNFALGLTPNFIYKGTAAMVMKRECGPVGDGNNHPFFEAAKKCNKASLVKRTKWEINRDFAEDLGRVKQPCLILMGEKDRFVKSLEYELEKLKELFVNRPMKITMIPNAGHVFFSSSSISIAVNEIEKFLDN